MTMTRHDAMAAAVHVHARDWRPCPWVLPDRLTPTKASAIWFYAFADAIQHLETFEVFIEANPSAFPRLAGKS